jgi:hypothetical protein
MLEPVYVGASLCWRVFMLETVYVGDSLCWSQFMLETVYVGASFLIFQLYNFFLHFLKIFLDFNIFTNK